MEIRVLGPVEVVSSTGTRIVIRSAKQRELLALLAAHAPEIVSTDRIVDALWGNETGVPLNTLHFHVSKLRDLVDPGRLENVIVTRAPGYGLGIPPESVDAHRFAALVAEAEQRKADNPAAVGSRLAEAEGLWRGSPYADFEYAEWARTEIQPLEELRLVATELRIDAELAAGRHRRLVPELESLLADEPLRERFWGQLMVALYRSSRQPEALRAYRRACEAFGELGTAPSANLKHLEEQILLREPALEAGATGASTAGNLPAPLSSFVGRDADVDAVRELVIAHRLVTMVGAGGVGKTRLAVEVARTLLGRYADGVWLVELAGVDDGDLAASQVARTLSVSDASGEDLVDSLAAALRHNDAVLVVDNCEHLVESVSSLVTDLLARCSQLRILVTSRRPLGVEGEVTWRTDPLSVETAGVGERPSGAVALFFDRTRAAQPSFEVTPETEALAVEVTRRLAGLPLAIELAAARLHMMSLRQLAARLDDEFELLTDGPMWAVAHHNAMRATLDWSYRLLAPAEQALFRRLAVFRGGFTLDSVERFLEAYPTRGNVLQLLGRLVDASMIVSSDDRFTMLEPIRQYGLLLLDEHGEKPAARATHAAVFRDMFQVPDSVLFAMWQVPGIAERFVTEMDNVRAALTWALESGDTATAIELGAVAASLFHRIGHLQEEKRWLDPVLAATSEATPHRARALIRAILIAGVQEGPDQAASLVDELADTAEMLDNEQWRAATVERRAILACFRDDLDTASTLFEEATERLLRLDHPESPFPLNNYVEILFWAGHYERADAVAERVADIGRRLDVPHAVARALRDQSYIAVNRGDPDGAERYLAAAEDHLLGEDRPDNVGTLDPTGGASVIRGFIALLRVDLDEAERLSSAAITDARQTRDPNTLFGGLVLAGLVHFHRNDVATAHRVLTEALREATRFHFRNWRRYVLGPFAATTAILEPAKGGVLLGAVEAADHRDGRTRSFPIARAVEHAVVELRQSLGANDLADAWHRGTAMTLDDAIAHALQPSQVTPHSQA